MTRSLNLRNVLVALALLLGAPGAGFASAPVLHALGGTDPATLPGGQVDDNVSETRTRIGRSLIPQPLPLPLQLQSPKSGAVAAGLEIVLPILGHGYAGNARRGILPAVLRVGGVVAFYSQVEDGFVPSNGVVYGGLAAVIGGTIWGIVSAVRTANDYNRSLSSDNASLTLLPTPDGGLGVGMAVRF